MTLKRTKIICPDCKGEGRKAYQYNGRIIYDACYRCDSKGIIYKVVESTSLWSNIKHYFNRILQYWKT